MNKLNVMLLVSAFVCGALHAVDATTEGEREEAKMSTQVAAVLVELPTWQKSDPRTLPYFYAGVCLACAPISISNSEKLLLPVPSELLF